MIKRVAAICVVVCTVCSPSANALTFALALQSIQSMFSTSSALSITTKQTAVSANQVSTANTAAGQQLANYIAALSMSNRVADAMIATDFNLGQPNTSKCIAQEQGAIHIESMSQRDKDTSHLMNTFSSSRVSSQSAANRQMLTTRRQQYCTASEAKQGMCELVPNGMQGWDSDYGGAFNEATLSPEAEVAAYAYVAMVADNRASVSIDCNSPACAAAQSEQMGLAAISSMSANSLVEQVTDRRLPVVTGN